MLTVPQVAQRVGRDPETVRRWIRSGRLRSHKIGTQHMIEEDDLAAMIGQDAIPRPRWLRRTHEGQPMPDSVSLIREVRASR